MPNGSTWIDDIISKLGSWRTYPAFNQLINDIETAYKNGDYRTLQGIFASPAFNISADQEKWLDNMIAQQNTEEARAYDTQMASTDLTRAAEQLQSLGLSASGVLQTGGSASTGVATASQAKTNIALEKYQQKMQIARQLLAMTSSMASAGVYGHAISSAKRASALLASQTANSARLVTRYDANDQRIGRTISENVSPDFDWNRLF